MPKLHKYRGRNACYVLTAIRGAVVTYPGEFLHTEFESKWAALCQTRPPLNPQC